MNLGKKTWRVTSLAAGQVGVQEGIALYAGTGIRHYLRKTGKQEDRQIGCYA